MPFARRYESFEVRRILQQSENQPSPATGAPAHARGLHAAPAVPHARTQFTTGMVDRTHKRPGESNNQFGQRGGVGTTSGFGNMLQQASALMQALNSLVGQRGLGILDRPAYAGEILRLKLVAHVTGETGFLPVDGHQIGMQSRKQVANLQSGGIAGIRAIIDRGPHGTELFVQTCFPIFADPAGNVEPEEAACSKKVGNAWTPVV